jgi:hypothetical protein
MNSHDAVRTLRRMMGADHSQLLCPWWRRPEWRAYQYVMHLDLVGGPRRIAQGDFPNRAWMRGIADFHLQRALAYEA